LAHYLAKEIESLSLVDSLLRLGMVAVLPQNIGDEEAIAAGGTAFAAAAATNRLDCYESGTWKGSVRERGSRSAADK
jgi:hypothetical protein